MCEYFCIGLIDFILKIESMLDRTNLFSDNDYEKMMKQLKKLFVNRFKNIRMRKIYCTKCKKYR